MRARCNTVTHVALDALRLIFETLWPVIPSSAERALAWAAQNKTTGEAGQLVAA